MKMIPLHWRSPEFGHFQSMQLEVLLDFLRLVLLMHLNLEFRNEAFLSPKGIDNPAQGCGGAATLG
jgi:hypothetical protein